MRRYFHRSAAIAASVSMLSLFGGCGGAAGIGGVPGAGATSQLCANVTGPLAIQYDVQNNVITTALTSVPTITTIGGNFIHPSYPLLSFIYPPGWTPETIQDGQTVGVNLIRDDQQAVWRWISTPVAVGTTARDMRDVEINLLLQFLGATGAVETVCLDEGVTTPAPGISVDYSSTLIQWDEFTAIVVASTSFVQGLPSGTAFAVVTAGPTAEMDALIFDTFLPIHFQLLVGDSSIVDSDGDGIQDSSDSFPFDPTRS